MRIFSLIIIATALMVGCDSGSSGKPSVKGITDDGFEYNIYKTGSSKQIANPGQYIYFTSGVLLDDDSELQPKSDIVRMQIPSDTAVQDPMQKSEEHTSELQSRGHLVCRLLLEKKKKKEK